MNRTTQTSSEMEYHMQKMLFTLTAIGLAAALSTAGSQKAEAASMVPASDTQISSASSVLLADWDGSERASFWGYGQPRHEEWDGRERPVYWGLRQHRHGEWDGNGYNYHHEGFGREGYRDRGGYENR
jgi:hypothetical protein